MDLHCSSSQDLSDVFTPVDAVVTVGLVILVASVVATVDGDAGVVATVVDAGVVTSLAVDDDAGVVSSLVVDDDAGVVTPLVVDDDAGVVTPFVTSKTSMELT